MNSTPVNALWTSGWDSTFRVASLLLTQGKTVQPWYVKDTNRRSTKVELRTMDKIRSALELKDPTIADRLLPTNVVPIEDIPADPETTQRYKELFRRSFLGGQYDWLSRLAQWKGITLELNVHRDDKAHDFLEGSVEMLEDGTYRLGSNDDEALSLFSPFIFPLLELTKPEMQSLAEEGGFGDIMEMTWFCFNPLLDGTPCGTCNPCRYTTEEGLGRRIPSPSLSRTIQAHTLIRVWQLRNRSRQLGRLIRAGLPR